MGAAGSEVDGGALGRRHADGAPLPLRERSDCIGRCNPGEGFASACEAAGCERADRTPHPALRATFSRKGRRKKEPYFFPPLLSKNTPCSPNMFHTHHGRF